MKTSREWKQIAKQYIDRMKADEAKKEALLSKNMDFAFLEELIQQTNQNPNLKVTVTLKDGTVLRINTEPKMNPYIGMTEQYQEEIEVR